MSYSPRRTTVFLYSEARLCGETCWRPLADVYRTNDGWVVKFELAGVRMDDVHVQLNGGRVTVSGIRRDWVLEEGASYYSMEIAYSRFERTIELPVEVECAGVHLEFRDGLLLVRFRVQEGER